MGSGLRGSCIVQSLTQFLPRSQLLPPVAMFCIEAKTVIPTEEMLYMTVNTGDYSELLAILYVTLEY